jgi:Tfp pilus assembly protein PilX
MNVLFKALVRTRSKNRGFVIPVVIALGLIMSLLGTISIFQSSDENLTASSQRATARALAAAEIGVTRYRELIDKYKVIAVYDACNGTWTNADCGDTSGISWKQATNIPNIAASCPTDGNTTVAAMATRAWQYVDANGDGNVDLDEYQYRLIDYIYTNNYSGSAYTGQPIGTLVVEGRVNQNNVNLTNDVNAAVANIEVDLPIQPGIPTPNAEIIQLEGNFNRFNPALWITGTPGGTINASVTDVNGLEVNGNIIITDTDCNITGTIPTTDNLQNSQTNSVIITPIQPSYKYPRVDVDGDGTDEVDTDWDQDVNNDGTNDINLINASNVSITSLPRPGDLSETRPDSSVYYHYIVNGNIDLSDQDINIVAGTKVILYVDGNIILTGNSADKVDLNYRTDNNNKSYNLEIYGTDQTNEIRLKGNGEINIKALIHAPNAQVIVEDDPTVTIKGAVWVKDWNGSSSLTTPVTISPDDPTDTTKISEQYSNYTYIKNDLVSAGARVVDPVISTPSRWETKQVN